MPASGALRTPQEVYPEGVGRSPFTLIDVRSPSEIARGALPYAHALPILMDDERHQVGLRYAHEGQEGAVRLGYDLTRGTLEERAHLWRTTAGDTPTAFVCWRGGLRSALAARHTNLSHAQPVAGGSKALRAHLMASMARRMAEPAPLLVVAGLTGSGKTALLADAATAGVPAVDLERQAGHRGSAFGAYAAPQPAQVTFENAVAADVILAPAGAIVVEDESRFIGARTVPDALWTAMRRAPVVWVDASLEERSERVFAEYVATPARHDGVDATAARLIVALTRLERRWGGDRVARARATITAARSDFFAFEAHRPWIEALLGSYYDRLYQHDFDASGRLVVFRGAQAAVADFLTRPQDATMKR